MPPSGLALPHTMQQPYNMNQMGQFFTSHAQSQVVTIASSITVKLTSENYMFWRAQVGPLLRSHLLMGYVDGSFSCPDPHIIVSHAAT
jgi:hypothetical protein